MSGLTEAERQELREALRAYVRGRKEEDEVQHRKAQH